MENKTKQKNMGKLSEKTTTNIVLANIPPNIINFHYWLLMKIFLTFGFGASGGTSQVPLRYQLFIETE